MVLNVYQVSPRPTSLALSILDALKTLLLPKNPTPQNRKQENKASSKACWSSVHPFLLKKIKKKKRG